MFDFTFFLSHYLLYIIIFIWIYTAPMSLKVSESLDSMFEHSEYKNLCNQFHICEYLWTWPCQQSPLRICINVCFIMAWSLSSFIVVSSLFLPPEFTWYTPQVLLTVALSIFALFLNLSSYYRSVLWAKFISKVSKLNTYLFQFNTYIPSHTDRLYRLYKTSTSPIFLIVALLFTLQYVVLQVYHIKDVSLPFIKIPHIILASIILLIFGICTFVLISIWPRLAIQKIYKKWIAYQLIKLQLDLYASDSSYSPIKSLTTLYKIQILLQDKLTFPSGIIDIVVAISTLCANLFGICSTVPSIAQYLGF